MIPPFRLPRSATARITGFVVVAAAVAGGMIARRTGVDLGAASAPFFLSKLHDSARHPWWPLPTLVLALVAGLALLRSPRLPTWAFVAGSFVLALGTRLGLAVGQRGVAEWWWPLTRPGARDTEYPSAYYFMQGHVLAFIDHFGLLVSILPVHPSGHPVGAMLAFFALDSLTGSLHVTAIALCALGALAVVPTLLLGRALTDDRSARRAVVLFALAPDTLIYGATSYDAAFVPITTLCAWLLVTRRVRTRRRRRLGVVSPQLRPRARAALGLARALATRGRTRGRVVGRRRARRSRSDGARARIRPGRGARQHPSCVRARHRRVAARSGIGRSAGRLRFWSCSGRCSPSVSLRPRIERARRLARSWPASS